MTIIHDLKTWPAYWQAALEGRKKFEVRRNDCDYQVGDIVRLHEYDPDRQSYTGRMQVHQITYILEGDQFGIEEGYVVFGLGELDLKKESEL